MLTHKMLLEALITSPYFLNVGEESIERGRLKEGEEATSIAVISTSS